MRGEVDVKDAAVRKLLVVYLDEVIKLLESVCLVIGRSRLEYV
jgi:hypothetical protein